MNTDLKKVKKKLREELDENRYNHTMGVAYTAASLAMRYKIDMEKALVAGLLHDCAKCIDNKKKIQMCKKRGIAISEVEERNPFLLHAKLGSFLAKETYGIMDQEILDAIQYHSTGREDMSMLEKIIFTADYIEPGRDEAPNLKEIREEAFRNIDGALVWILHDTLEYIKIKKAELDLTTLKAYEYYSKKLMIEDGVEREIFSDKNGD